MTRKAELAKTLPYLYNIAQKVTERYHDQGTRAGQDPVLPLSSSQKQTVELLQHGYLTMDMLPMVEKLAEKHNFWAHFG